MGTEEGSGGGVSRTKRANLFATTPFPAAQRTKLPDLFVAAVIPQHLGEGCETNGRILRLSAEGC